MTFYEEIYKLKTVVRTGWKMCCGGGGRTALDRLESDAEHTFSMIMLALELIRKNNLKLNELKVLKMIAFHELCEIDVQDFTPLDQISKAEKFNQEKACVHRLSVEYDMPEIEELWLEFEEEKTPEAKFVKDIDHYDAVKQAEIYSKLVGKPEIYEEFACRHKDCVKRMKKLETKKD